mmetsp:Transcript_12048/g.25898  ORF Transcript_12048/g.25898 Transcript_12048/m.25898 type:complete len:485 (+) Transcript_12048:462-1916(+)
MLSLLISHPMRRKPWTHAMQLVLLLCSLTQSMQSIIMHNPDHASFLSLDFQAALQQVQTWKQQTRQLGAMQVHEQQQHPMSGTTGSDAGHMPSQPQRSRRLLQLPELPRLHPQLPAQLNPHHRSASEKSLKAHHHPHTTHLASGWHGAQHSPLVSEPCRYGELPGVFLPGQEAGARYQLHGRECRLDNMIARLQAGDPELVGRQMSILMLGDSVDWYAMKAMCKWILEGEVQPNELTRRQHLTWCETPKYPLLQLGMMYIPGVHPAGPYFNHLNPNTSSRITLGIEQFKAAFGVSHPHMLVVSANFWDLARACTFESPHHCSASGLPLPFLDHWLLNYTAVVQQALRELQPHRPLLVTHTQAMPRIANHSTGAFDEAFLGYSVLVAQLNSMAREAARQLGMQLVDLAAMAGGLPADQALMDEHHPVYEMQMEVFNIYLNMLLRHFSTAGYTPSSLPPEEAASLHREPPPPPPHEPPGAPVPAPT